MTPWRRKGNANASATERIPGETTVTALLQAPISGTVAVGTNIDQRVLNLGGVHGGVVTIIEGTVVTPTRRPRPVLMRPARPELVLDRAPIRELARPTSISRELELYGEPGSGKTTLLEELAWTVGDADYPDGVVYLSLRSYQVNDALHDIWSAFYECSTPFKPVDSQRRVDLGPTRALVLLDDVELEPDELRNVMHLLANSRCIVATLDRRLWGEGRSISVAGLPSEDAIPLIEHSIGRTLSAQERALVIALWQSSGGHPLRLQQSFVAVIAGAEQGTTRETVGASLPSVTEEPAPGQAEVVDRTALDRILRPATLPGVSSDLVSRVESQTDQWRASTLAFLSRQNPERDASAETSERLQLDRLLIEWGLTSGHYESALRLARSTEAVLAVRGYWDAWLRVLDGAYSAAIEASDLNAQAWALHQKGTRALCLGDMVTAESALAASLDLRRRTGDDDGAAVTRHNLQLAEGARGGHVSHARRLIVAASLVVALLVVTGGVAAARQWWPFHPESAGTSSHTLSPTDATSTTDTTGTTGTTPTSRSPSTSSSVTTSVPSSIPPLGPAIAASPKALTFLDTGVGLSRSLSEMFTMRGGALPDISLSDGSAFSVDNGCATASTASRCSVTVLFKPIAVGQATATLTATLPGGSKVTVALSGTGVPVEVTIELVNDSPKNYVPPTPVITGNGISCPSACTVSVQDGTDVSLTAVDCVNGPCTDGMYFDGWGGQCSGTDLTCQFTASRPSDGASITVHYSYSFRVG